MAAEETDDEIVLSIDDGNIALVGRVARIGWWVMLIIFTLLVLPFVLGSDRPPAAVSAVFIAALAGLLWLVRWMTQGDRSLGALRATGSVVLDDAGVHLAHDPVLATPAFVPWSAVNGIVIDQGRGRGFPYETDVKTRFLLENGWSGLAPDRRPPLLAAGPVRPNLLFVIDPPIQMEWAHPTLRAIAFTGFRGPGVPALPWTSPAETAAVWMRVGNLTAIKKSRAAAARIRPLTKTDVHRFRYEFGDLPGPNPYRHGGTSRPSR